MGTSASAAEEAKRVLPQSVTNASLDTRRGHSSLLSLGDNVPLRHLLLSRLHMHAFLHINAADTALLHTSTHAQMYTDTQLHLHFIIGHSALLILPPAQ